MNFNGKFIIKSENLNAFDKQDPKLPIDGWFIKYFSFSKVD